MATDRESPQKRLRFSIFRAADADPKAGIPNMTTTPVSDIAREGAGQLVAAGMENGHENRVLFSGGGMSLLYAWFKSGYPLPRHSHDSDCLYFILGGSIQVGTETLGPGDGFFVGGDAPYTYVPGEEGVEIIEFRATEQFDIKLLADNPAFWQKALQNVVSRQEKWQTESRPSAVIKQ